MEQWLVFGSGKSGINAALFIKKKYKHNVEVFDNNPISLETQKLLDESEINFINHIESIQNYSKVVLSPGVPLWNPIVKNAIESKIPVIGEISLALENYEGKIIAVTGTNGKSTVVSMISHILDKLGLKNSLTGNIGIPPTEILLHNKLEDILVLELSSYQLETTNNLYPNVAIITNFTEDHLYRHKTMQEYFRCKWKIIDRVNKDSIFITDQSCLDFAYANQFKMPNQLMNIQSYPADFNDKILNRHTCVLTEKHNLTNAFFALNAVLHITNFSESEILNALKSFNGLEHRCEKFFVYNGVTFINDSKATNVQSTITALQAMDSKVDLFLGGEPKGESFTSIARYKEKINKIVAFGKAKDLVYNDLNSHFKIDSYETLEQAIEEEYKTRIFQSDIILFSPACASFDEFNNFEHRGNYFKKKVKSLLE